MSYKKVTERELLGLLGLKVGDKIKVTIEGHIFKYKISGDLLLEGVGSLPTKLVWLVGKEFEVLPEFTKVGREDAMRLMVKAHTTLYVDYDRFSKAQITINTFDNRFILVIETYGESTVLIKEELIKFLDMEFYLKV